MAAAAAAAASTAAAAAIYNGCVAKLHVWLIQRRPVVAVADYIFKSIDIVDSTDVQAACVRAM